MPDYASVADVRTALRVADFDDDPAITVALTAAEAMIDAHCGQRFAVPNSATARTFIADWCSPLLQLRSPIANTAGLAVAVDLDGDGSYETTVAASAWQLQPLDGVGPDGRTGWPYTSLLRLDGAYWPALTSGRPGVQITARWGWAATPAPVRSATILLAAELWKLNDAPLGTGTFGANALRIEDNAGVVSLLGPYRLAHAIAGIA